MKVGNVICGRLADDDQHTRRGTGGHPIFAGCRGDLTETFTRVKQRILAFLLTRGFQYPGKTRWTKTFHTWVRTLPMGEMDQITLHTYLYQLEQLEQEVHRIEAGLAAVATRARYQAPVKVLMAFRGIGLVTALTLIFELGDIRRFSHPRQLMAYLGLVPSEHSSGTRTKRGGTTKTGNVHVRNAVISAAWKYARPPRCSRELKERQQAISAEVAVVTWKAQRRLYKRFHKLCQTKPRCVANTAIARGTGRLFVGGTAPGKPIDHHPRAGLNHGLGRSDWHGWRTHETPLRASASYR